MTERRPLQLRLRVSAPPQPTLLRGAIAAALAGRRVPGPEGEVGRQVAAAVARMQREAQPWR